MKKLVSTSLVLALAIATMFSFGSIADAGAKHKKVVYLDYNYQVFYKPSEIFLQANSGPYLKNIKWTGWGKSKSVGRGRFIADCASCFPKENRAVTITFHKLINCKYAPNIRIYRYGLIHVKDKTRKRTLKWNGQCPPKGWKNF